jgi:hypothetical protein
MRGVCAAVTLSVALLAGCGGSDRGSATPSTPTTSKAMQAKCRRLASTWHPMRYGVVARPPTGAHLRMRVGETRLFQIVIYPDTYTGWTQPASSNPQSVQLSGVRDPLRDGISYNCLVSGIILARAPGTAVLGSSTDAPCFHDPSHTCAMPTLGWSVTVTVVSG